MKQSKDHGLTSGSRAEKNCQWNITADCAMLHKRTDKEGQTVDRKIPYLGYPTVDINAFLENLRKRQEDVHRNLKA